MFQRNNQNNKSTNGGNTTKRKCSKAATRGDQANQAAATQRTQPNSTSLDHAVPPRLADAAGGIGIIQTASQFTRLDRPVGQPPASSTSIASQHLTTISQPTASLLPTIPAQSAHGTQQTLHSTSFQPAVYSTKYGGASGSSGVQTMGSRHLWNNAGNPQQMSQGSAMNGGRLQNPQHRQWNNYCGNYQNDCGMPSIYVQPPQQMMQTIPQRHVSSQGLSQDRVFSSTSAQAQCMWSGAGTGASHQQMPNHQFRQGDVVTNFPSQQFFHQSTSGSWNNTHQHHQMPIQTTSQMYRASINGQSNPQNGFIGTQHYRY